MEIKTDILDELRSLSPLIAGMKKVNIFTVPQGYFDSISSTVLACLEEEYGFSGLPGNKQSPPVPDGYFDQLANAILEKIKDRETASDEIRNLSPLLYAIQSKNVFEVPSGYFESLDKVIVNKIEPTGAKEELKQLSRLLYNIQSKAVFEVPDGYFAALPDDILKKAKPPLSKVVVMRKRSLFMKYSVAAMLIGLTALGLYKYIDKGPADITSRPAPTLDASIEKGKKMNDNQFNEALANLNGNDIAKYLENNGDITDVAVLGNNLEDINLPSQDDYLLDETTLDNYLSEIEKTTVNN